MTLSYSCAAEGSKSSCEADPLLSSSLLLLATNSMLLLLMLEFNARTFRLLDRIEIAVEIMSNEYGGFGNIFNAGFFEHAIVERKCTHSTQ